LAVPARRAIAAVTPATLALARADLFELAPAQAGGGSAAEAPARRVPELDREPGSDCVAQRTPE
jgi:hypothetical protein